MKTPLLLTTTLIGLLLAGATAADEPKTLIRAVNQVSRKLQEKLPPAIHQGRDSK